MLYADQEKIRVLVVDDSSFIRLAIRKILSRDQEIEVVGVAADGREAVELALKLKPDVITMDIEMPVMDGISAVKEIMASHPARILMVSTLTREGARATFMALEAGALDFVLKNTNDSFESRDQFRDELLRKVKGVYSHRSHAVLSSRPPQAPPEVKKDSGGIIHSHLVAVAIGTSTGGPAALKEVLIRVPGNFPLPIVVAIHMPMPFTGHFAEHLNAKCPLDVVEAADGDLLTPGRVFISPGGQHTTFVQKRGQIIIKTLPSSDFPKNFYIPSVDIMMTSLADACSGPVLGVILTGMGNDGFKGMQYLKAKGGITLVQDESTSIIYGMPRACVQGEVADLVLPLDKIGPKIMDIAR